MAQAETAQGAQRWRRASHSRVGDEAFLSHVYSDRMKTNVSSPLDALPSLNKPIPPKPSSGTNNNWGSSILTPPLPLLPSRLGCAARAETPARHGGWPTIKALSSFGGPLFCHHPSNLYRLFSGDLHVKLVSFSLFCQTSQSTSAPESSRLSRRRIPACTKTSGKRQTRVDQG